MANARRYIITKTESRQSGTTTITTVTTVSPTLIDFFSGSTFSYSAITTSQLAQLSDADYTLRLNDYLTLLSGIDSNTINNLSNTGAFDDPSCVTPVYLTNIGVSCVYPPISPTGGTFYTISGVDNGEGSGYYSNISGGVEEEDDFLVYAISYTPSDASVITCIANYELATSVMGTGAAYTAEMQFYKNGLVTGYTANTTTPINANISFTMTGGDVIKITLRTRGHHATTGTSSGGGISSFEIQSATSNMGTVANVFPIPLLSAKVGVYR